MYGKKIDWTAFECEEKKKSELIDWAAKVQQINSSFTQQSLIFGLEMKNRYIFISVSFFSSLK